jgi:hypothetical protein
VIVPCACSSVSCGRYSVHFCLLEKISHYYVSQGFLLLSHAFLVTAESKVTAFFCILFRCCGHATGLYLQGSLSVSVGRLGTTRLMFPCCVVSCFRCVALAVLIVPQRSAAARSRHSSCHSSLVIPLPHLDLHVKHQISYRAAPPPAWHSHSRPAAYSARIHVHLLHTAFSLDLALSASCCFNVLLDHSIYI